MFLNQSSEFLLLGLDGKFCFTFHPHIAIFSFGNHISHVNFVPFCVSLNGSDPYSFSKVFVHFVVVNVKLGGNLMSLKVASELIGTKGREIQWFWGKINPSVLR